MPVRPAMNTHTSAGSGPSGSHTASPRMSVSSAPPSGSRHRDQPFAGRHRRQRHAARLDRDLLQAQAAGGVIDRDVRPAVGPAAAEREVEAQAEPTRRRGAVTHGVEEGRRQERMIDEAAAAIVGDERVDRLHLDAAEAGVVHRLQLAVEALGRDGGAEPPPPHHRPRVRGRLLPHAPQIGQRIGALRGGDRHGREQHRQRSTTTDRVRVPPVSPGSPWPPRSASRRREEAHARAAPHPVPLEGAGGGPRRSLTASVVVRCRRRRRTRTSSR